MTAPDEVVNLHEKLAQVAERIELEPRSTVELGAGDFYVVPRGAKHRPVADVECQVLLLEPVGTVNTGDAGGEFTRAAEWL